MNIGSIIPQVNSNIAVHRPIKVTDKGNLYKIPMLHQNAEGVQNKFEVWTTKEAVQQHFQGMTENPREYQLKKFARQMYEKQMRSRNGQLTHQGILVTTDSVEHGNPKLWPMTLSHPEIKM